MAKEIWLPDSTTHVSVQDGKVKVWDTMVMSPKPINKKSLGFNEIKIRTPFDNKEEELEHKTGTNV